MEKRLVFLGKQQVTVETFTTAAPAVGEVAVRVRRSLISTGTEGIVFNRWFDAGTHWDNWVKYPFLPGYSAVGEVAAVGPEVTTLKVGDRVACRSSHASWHLVKATSCFPIPAGVDDAEATWFALAKIAAMGARAANYKLGSSALIIGAGPIGQMSVRWAAAAGCARVFVVDPVAGRLELARRGGATATFAQPADQALAAIEAANGGHKPEIVLDTTGNAQVFTAALAAADRFGTVVVLGDTGSPAQQHLSSDLMMRGLRIVGAHDGHETPDWNSPRIVQLFFHLVQTGRFPLAGLNTHEFAPDDAVAAYDLVSKRRAESMGILFKW